MRALSRRASIATEFEAVEVSSKLGKPRPRLLAFATLGSGSNEEARIRTLLRDFEPDVLPFDRTHKRRMFWLLLKTLYKTRPAVVVMEGTGLAGGAALIAARILFGQRYVVGSGDAVGPWVGTRVRLLGPIFGLYERILCRLAAGFIGWTPYLVGRALTFGAPRAMTAAGWAPFTRTLEEQSLDRIQMRERLGIPANNLVVGIAGSMAWSARRRYCYGLELVQAALRVNRSDVTFLLVGDGNGRPELERLAAPLPKGRILFMGRVSQEELPAYYAAMDVGSLPQSVDRVGSFRYTTKISEYIAFRLPIVTGTIPLGYDLDDGWIWRLPGAAPWTDEYAIALADLLNRLEAEELQKKRASVPLSLPEFDCLRQIQRVTSFIDELLL